MNRLHAVGCCCIVLLSAAFARGAAAAADAAAAPSTGAGLHASDHVAVIGDSITEQKMYSVFIEDYLLMCKPQPGLSVTQFGWGGETSWGFAARVGNDMLPFGATAATTCYGMNDGGYSPMNDQKAKHYHDAQTSVVEQLKAGGVRFIVVGSPGCVDADTYHHSSAQAEMYNQTLAAERDLARQVAQEQGVAFADVYSPMIDVMTKAKAKFGKAYDLAGGDGVHPNANGHLVMAYAFLKGLGCNGEIGTITIDLAAGKAQATEDHKVLSTADGKVEIESSRYPFCFFGTGNTSASTRGILEFFPFNDDLNRFKLIVTGGKGEKLKVTWGAQSKEFPAADLAKGINLAAEFLDNPFADAFKKVDTAVRQQQNFETPLVKTTMHGLLELEKQAPEEKDAIRRIGAALAKKDKPLRDASAAAVQPVRHTIQVEEVK